MESINYLGWFNMIIKFCGNRSFQDLQLSLNSQATHIGLIFAQKSKRYVAPEQLAGWLPKLENASAKTWVGVFVNPSMGEIMEVLEKVPLDVIQCHGTETPEFLLKVKEDTKKRVWKVIHHAPDSLDRMRKYKGIADGYVIDKKTATAWGGTGLSFEWSYAPLYLEEAKRQKVPCLIAGGINPKNLAHLLDYDPDGIDLASGIETANQKDITLIQQIEEKVLQS